MPIPAILGGAVAAVTLGSRLKQIIQVLGWGFAGFQALLGVGTALSAVADIQTPASQFLDAIYGAFTGVLGVSFDDVVQMVDKALPSSSGRGGFSPAFTLSGFLQKTGFGSAFNRVVQCFFVSLNFLISVRLLRWASGGLGKLKVK